MGGGGVIQPPILTHRKLDFKSYFGKSLQTPSPLKKLSYAALFSRNVTLNTRPDRSGLIIAHIAENAGQILMFEITIVSFEEYAQSYF